MDSRTPGHTIVQSSEETVDVAAEEESLVGVGAADVKPMAAMKAIVEALKNIVMVGILCVVKLFRYVIKEEKMEVVLDCDL